MKYANLWTIPPVAAPSQSTESAVEILKEQAQYLGDNMGGKVSASFHTLPSYGGFLADYADYEVDGKSRGDADELYGNQRYAFDIYNSAYLFRLFTMYLPPFYPVEINLDGDLMEAVRHSGMEIGQYYLDEGEVEYTEYVKINSDDDLINLLKKIFAARKVQFMLYKLRQQSEEAEKKGA